MKKYNIYISPGNTKVDCPIFNSGSGTDCPNAFRCRFSSQNHKAQGCALCYAQKIEWLRKNVLKSRRKNADIIAQAQASGEVSFLADYVADKISRMLSKRDGARVCRLNEAHDVSYRNLEFHVALIRALVAQGIKPYMYTNADSIIVGILRQAGAIVLISEQDFIAVRKGDNPPDGMAQCPGRGCGGACMRCPSGLKSWIREH